jgi:hypothetical protein
MLNGAKGATELNRCWRLVGVEERSEQSTVELGVEDGNADAFGRHGVRVRPRHALNQSVETESAQVITHLRRAVVTAEESGDMPAKAFVREAGDGMDDEAQ